MSATRPTPRHGLSRTLSPRRHSLRASPTRQNPPSSSSRSGLTNEASWMVVGLCTMSSFQKLYSCHNPFFNAEIAEVCDIAGSFARISSNLVICLRSVLFGPCAKFHRSGSVVLLSIRIDYCLRKTPDNWLKLLIEPDSSWVNHINACPDRFLEKSLQ